MPTSSVTVMGAGVAGLSAALLLARDGHRVTVLERDVVDAGAPADAPAWRRRGIPHFLQPHAFVPRGRLELMQQLPDVYATLLAAGAYDVDLRRKLPGSALAGDEDLQYLAVRRPMIEWGLRRAVLADPRIDVRSGVRVEGLRVDRGRVVAVRVAGSEQLADVVVDALGRRSATADWLAASGVEQPPADSSDCGVVYYCRYYRVRKGHALPDGPWLLSPRGDLGYFGYASFPGDNGTFAALLAVPNRAPEWRAFTDVSVFEAAVARIPALRLWADPAAVEAITDVMPMAGLRNSLRHDAGTAAVVRVGDSLCHTDPVLAHGLAFALIHARELTTALSQYADTRDAFAAFGESTASEMRERYDYATALDEQRHRMWVGGRVDLARHDGDYALFSMVAAGAVAMVDADVFRAFVRRIGLLDSTAVLDSDVGLQRRIEDAFAQLLSRPRPAVGPSREEMLAVVASG